MPLLIDIRKLAVINELVHCGAGNVADALCTMAGVDASVEVKSISFVSPSDIPREMGSGDLYGASIRLREPPYGVFLMTFSNSTAVEIAEHVTDTPVEGGFDRLQESALQEICNVTTSGFVDGIANSLGTTIDMETPQLQHATGEEISEQTLTHVDTDSLSIVLDSVVDVTDADSAFQIRIFLVPDPGAFVNLVDKIDVESVSSTHCAGAEHSP